MWQLLSDIGYVPTPNVHSDVWDHAESYTIYMLLACRLKITFTFSLKLIIFFLEQLQHLLLPSLIVTSSQVRVGMPFPLQCAVTLAWGQKAYFTIVRFRYGLPVTYLGWPLHLGETLPLRTSDKKLNGRRAVSMRLPTLQHPLEKYMTSSRELCSMRDFLQTHLQEPDFFLVHESRVSQETRLVK